jgi:hypothetical protein
MAPEDREGPGRGDLVTTQSTATQYHAGVGAVFVELTDPATATNCWTDSNPPIIVSGSGRPTHCPDRSYSNQRRDTG